MIDTAQAYQNEEGVGNAWKKSGIRREDLFLVSKIWFTNYGYEQAKASIDESLHKMQTEYLDLMLLYQPYGDRYGAYRALEDAYREGKLRAIGVSNFYPDHYIDLCAHFDVVPQVNQVETHVFCQQVESRKYMDELGIAHMSWGPLAEGKNGFFQNETLIAIGEKYGKTGPQVALRYLLQRGVIIIPKSSKKERMMQNLDLFDFTLSEEDMKAILLLDTAQPLIMPSHHSPEITKWFMSLLPRNMLGCGCRFCHGSDRRRRNGHPRCEHTEHGTGARDALLGVSARRLHVVEAVPRALPVARLRWRPERLVGVRRYGRRC